MQIKTVESLSHSSQNSYHQGNQKRILVRVEAGRGKNPARIPHSYSGVSGSPPPWAVLGTPREQVAETEVFSHFETWTSSWTALVPGL